MGSAYQAAGTATPAETCVRSWASEARGTRGATAGAGSLARCRASLRASLEQALKVPATEVYRDDACRAGDQKCFDAIVHRPLGAVTQPMIDWVQPAPPVQQVVEIKRRRPR